MRRQGHATIREWFNGNWKDAPDTQNSKDLRQSAILADMRIADYNRSGGPPAVAWALTQDDQLEILITQLAGAREFRLTGDSIAANAVLALDPTGSVLPSWQQDYARNQSQQVFKQHLRARKPYTGPEQAKGKAEAGKGKGKGAEPTSS